MTTDLDDELSLEDLLERHHEVIEAGLDVALVGRVESYDAVAQTADVKPVVRAATPTARGTHVHEELPVVRAVPVLWPRTASYFVHLPLAAGDTVLLVCLDRDHARWIATGEVSPPPDVRAHHLSHAIAIPGIFPRASRLGNESARTDALVIGREGDPSAVIRIQDDGKIVLEAGDIRLGAEGATSLVALANLVKARLDTIQAAFDAHQHSGVTVGMGATGAPTAVIGALDDVASSKVRSE